MKNLVLIFSFSYFSLSIYAQKNDLNIEKIKLYYPQVIDCKDNKVIFNDNTYLIYDDKKSKNHQELLDNPDIEDQFRFDYKTTKKLQKNEDPGRIRNEAFFRKIYGNSKAEVESKLVEVSWCPKLVNQKIMITSVNGIDKIVSKLSAELDNHPEFKPYLLNIAGTFAWRNIAGSNRLSMHSFGMTMDINLEKTNYWQWDCKCKNESVKLKYKNKIPLELVEIFEKYGFIWGGKWYHYDTMHFEYRPELIF